MREDEEEEVEGEKGEEEEGRNFRKWKECKYSITGSRGFNLPVACRLFHECLSEKRSQAFRSHPEAGCSVLIQAIMIRCGRQ